MPETPRPPAPTADLDYQRLLAEVQGLTDAVERAVAAHDLPTIRRLSAELTHRLDDAERLVLRRLSERPGAPLRRRRRRHEHAPVDPDLAPWSTELVRIAQTRGWLRRTGLDLLGVLVPGTVRVPSRAATGPHIPGLEFEPGGPPPDSLPRQLIGVDLPTLVDSEAREVHGAGRQVQTSEQP